MSRAKVDTLATPVHMEDDRASIEFVLTLARALHRYGTPAHRLEEAITVVCRRLGINAEVFSTPTTIIMSFGAPAELRTRMMRMDEVEMNMHKLAQVDAIANDVVAQRVSLDEGLRRIAKVQHAPKRYGRVISTATHAVTAGSVAVFFGGSLRDVGSAAVIGLLLGVLGLWMKRSSTQTRLYELVGAALAAFTAGAAGYWVGASPTLVTVAGLVVLLPGMSLTIAMTELATRNLISGTARLMAAVLVLLELVFGVAIGERLAHEVFAFTPIVLAPLPSWAPWAALTAAALAMTVVVQASPRSIGWIVAACFAGYLGAKLGTRWLDPRLGVVVGALALGVLGNFYARVLDRPAQVVLVPATLLLVPGSMGFRGMSSLLGHDTMTGVETMFAMFVVAVSIVAGMLMSNAIVSPRRVL